MWRENWSGVRVGAGTCKSWSEGENGVFVCMGGGGSKQSDSTLL